MRKISRRSFLIGGAALATSALTGCFKVDPPTGSNIPKVEDIKENIKEKISLNILSDDEIRFIRQLVGKTPDTRKVIFEGLKELNAPKIELKDEKGVVSEIAANYAPFTDNDNKRYQYEAELTNLASGRSYEYRVLTSDGASEWMKFKVADDNKLKVLIFPDSQSADYSGWGKLAKAAYKNNNETELFINMGDLVDNGQDHSQWAAWFRALNGVQEHIPCSPILGNHECYNDQWKVHLPEAYVKYFPLPKNGSQNFDRYYYAYDLGPCRFIALSTEWDEIGDFKSGLAEEEKEWIINAAKSDKPWKVVMMHRDVLQYRTTKYPDAPEGFTEQGMIFMPLFEKLNIDIVFTAHLHTYRNRGRLKHFDSANSGPYYILTGVAGDVRYPNLWVNHALDKLVAPQPETDNYLTMTADNNTVNIKCYRDDGQLLDNMDIRKG